MEQARISNQQGNQAAQAARGKPAASGKNSAADAQGDAAAGGFMALLSALGDGGLQDTLTPQATVDGAETPPADMLHWQWQATVQVAEQIPSDGPLPEGSLLLQTALLDAAGVAEMQGAVAGAGKRKTLGRLAPGVAPANDAGPASGVQGLVQAGAKSQSASSTQDAQFQSLVADRRDAGAPAREGARPAEQGLDGVPTTLAQWASDAAAGPRMVARGSESGGDVSGAGGTAEPIQDRPLGLVGEVAAEGVNPAMAGAEDALTEQVAYWVHQNIQNARLTVTHDGQPVDVHVSLTGKEAHVSFGSDEAQTRDLIGGSVAQLRDMLHQEGLVLSGMTVGESGRRPGNEGTGSGGERSHAQKQARVVVPTAAVRPVERVHVSGDRAVDIFV